MISNNTNHQMSLSKKNIRSIGNRYYDYLALRRCINSIANCREQSRVLLFSNLGLGDQISLIPAYEYWTGLGIEVIVPVKNRNHGSLGELCKHLPDLHLVGFDMDSIASETIAIYRFAKVNNIAVVDGGRRTYRSVSRFFPELGINGRLALAIGSDPSRLVSETLRRRFEDTDGEVPDENYAFVDHHEHTRREIPPGVLESVRLRGLDLRFNDRTVPISEMGHVMARAKELHLVSSAPLCLALVSDLSSSSLRVRYRNNDEHPLMLDYPTSWHEYSLDDRGLIRAVNRDPEFKIANESRRDRLKLDVQRRFYEVLKS